MTDASNPANGQQHRSGSQWNSDVREMSGVGVFGDEETSARGEESLGAPDSGKTSGWPSRTDPAAASPAGWFPPPPRGAAPSVRLREPARSGETYAHPRAV